MGMDAHCVLVIERNGETCELWETAEGVQFAMSFDADCVPNGNWASGLL